MLCELLRVGELCHIVESYKSRQQTKPKLEDIVALVCRTVHSEASSDGFSPELESLPEDRTASICPVRECEPSLSAASRHAEGVWAQTEESRGLHLALREYVPSLPRCPLLT